MAADHDYYLGIMSGTSVDSIDVVIVDLAEETPVLVSSHNHAWPEDVRRAIFATRALADEELGELKELDDRIAEVLIAAIDDCISGSGLRAEDITAIGDHGQTIRHRPDAAEPFSLQLDGAERVAAHTGITVVSDFRTADIELSGQGAPLVPAFHNTVFRSYSKNRVIVNIGGIANITYLPAGDGDVIGFDTGPGNTLMDTWCKRHCGQPYDKDGTYADRGTTDSELLEACLAEPYFTAPPPKSTGFELFNLNWLASKMRDDLGAEDVQSTLCDLTAITILAAIDRYVPECDEVFVCGGGVHNHTLMNRLISHSHRPVASTADLGVDPDWVEAMTFAWLAKQHLAGLPGNIPSVTGASDETVLGVLYTA